jgi:opacity protein-like surface antigen
MRVRFITTCALGLAAALTLDASPLAAQSQDTTKLRRTTRSTQRIPITKEAPGEVVTIRVDTVFVTRHDTVTNTVLRIDTVTVTPPPPVIIPKPREWNWGLFAGPSIPTGAIDRLLTNGYQIGGLVGWDSPQYPFGFRLDGAVSQLGRERLFFNTGQLIDFNNDGIINQIDIDDQNFIFGFSNDAPVIWTLALDGKLHYPSGGWSPYVIGGMQWNSTKRVPLRSDFDNNCDFIVRGDCFQFASDNWRNTWGWNAGLGTDFHIGGQDMFVEGRYMSIQRNGSSSYYVPVTLGVRFF